MLITAVTTWFPTQQAPSRGSFVVRDIHAISTHHAVRCIHLVPPQDDDGSRHTYVDGIETLRIPMNPKNPASIVAAARELRSALHGTDVLHSMAFSSLLPLVIPGTISPALRQHWLHTEHWSGVSSPHLLGPSRAVQPILLGVLRAPTHVTAVCNYLADPIRKVRGAKPVSIVPCIVEPYPVTPRRDRIDGSLRLVSTGGLVPGKDPLTAVRTIADLRTDGVDASLTWLGAGPLEGEVQELAVKLGIKNYVKLPGTVNSAEVRRQLGEHDMFFGPTLADNFFVSAAEAIIAGRPVVAGATGGHGEYISEEVGRLVAVQEPRAYADAILELDTLTRGTPSEVIAATIGDKFSSQTVGRAYASLCESLCAH